MKLVIKGIAILMAVTLSSCGKGTSPNEISSADIQLENISKAKKEDNGSYMTTDSTFVQGNSTELSLQAGQPSPTIDWDKKIIKTANVTLELKEYKTFNNNIHNITRRYGAYIAAEQQNESDAKIENTISIKVPVDQFENLMNSLPTDEVKVIEKRIVSEDVSGEVVDAKARIEARKQVRERYLTLLKQAKTMKEILEVEQTINAVQEEIEAGSGRVQYLTHQAAYSTIHLTYYQYLTATPSTGNEEPTFFTELKEAFKDGTSIIGSLLLVLVTIWPLLLVAFIVWYLAKRHSLKSAKMIKKQVEVTT